jgi:error-prone DNA polymerase
MSAPHGALVRAAGLVICRQQPMTASGVVFVTMEDETGFINLVLWARVFDKFRHVATTSSLLMAHGKIERSEGAIQEGVPDVVYIVVDRLERLRMPPARGAASHPLPSMSRDFH